MSEYIFVNNIFEYSNIFVTLWTRLAQPKCYLIPCVNMHHISIITSNSHFCHHQYHHLLLVMVISSTSLYYISLLSYIQTYISLLTDIQIWKTKAIIIFFLSSPFSIAIISGQCSNGFWGSNAMLKFHVGASPDVLLGFMKFLASLSSEGGRGEYMQEISIIVRPKPRPLLPTPRGSWRPIAEHYKFWWSLHWNLQNGAMRPI